MIISWRAWNDACLHSMRWARCLGDAVCSWTSYIYRIIDEFDHKLRMTSHAVSESICWLQAAVRRRDAERSAGSQQNSAGLLSGVRRTAEQSSDVCGCVNMKVPIRQSTRSLLTFVIVVLSTAIWYYAVIAMTSRFFEANACYCKN